MWGRPLGQLCTSFQETLGFLCFAAIILTTTQASLSSSKRRPSLSRPGGEKPEKALSPASGGPRTPGCPWPQGQCLTQEARGRLSLAQGGSELGASPTPSNALVL